MIILAGSRTLSKTLESIIPFSLTTSLIVLPVLIWAFLSIPTLYYATNYSALWKVFDIAYVNLNFNFVVLIVGVFSPIFYLFKKASRIVFT